MCPSQLPLNHMICYTREFTDHRNLQGFSLGCVVETRRHLFLDALKLLGKRDSEGVDSPPPDQCYECCSSDDCNGNLCQGKETTDIPSTHLAYPDCPSCPQTTTSVIITSSPTTTSTTYPATTHQQVSPALAAFPNTGCPPHWVLNKDSCDFFATLRVNWEQARAYCQEKAGDLVSVNTQDEQLFLVQHLDIIASTEGSFWTGGSYSAAIHQWEWVDRSPMTYTNWYPGEPGALSYDRDYYIFMTNPNYSSSYKGGPWGVTVVDRNMLPFICEKQTT